MRSALHVVILLVASSVAGCSTLSLSERSAACGTTDWYAYGLNDGRLGVPESERQDLFAECLKAGATVDLAQYRAGRAEGLAEYCTVETGFEVGRAGGRYREVCSGQAETAFLQGYERGRAEWRPVAVSPRIGLGIGIGDGDWGGVGIGFPFYFGGHRHGLPRLHDYCFYNRPYCEARGWL